MQYATRARMPQLISWKPMYAAMAVCIDTTKNTCATKSPGVTYGVSHDRTRGLYRIPYRRRLRSLRYKYSFITTTCERDCDVIQSTSASEKDPVSNGKYQQLCMCWTAGKLTFSR
eukprot:8462053-Pyramimonas_sp.AAC.1